MLNGPITSVNTDGAYAASSVEPLLYVATLVKGRIYVLRTKAFLLGVGVPVTATERSHLEVHAVERLVRPDFDPFGEELPEDAIEAVCAFTFSPLERVPDDDPISQPETPPSA